MISTTTSKTKKTIRIDFETRLPLNGPLRLDGPLLSSHNNDAA